MKKPVIMLSHKFSDSRWGLGRSYMSQSNYARAFERAGAACVISAMNDPEVYADLCDGVLFTGGGDVDPERYGEKNVCDIKSDPILDDMELRLFAEFFKRGKPIMGICRGIQLVNVAMGGTLVQDVPSQITLSAHKQVYQDNIPRHMVKTTPGTAIHSLFGDEVMTNSYHHQAVKTCGKGMRAAAVTDEGLIEAIEHESLPIIAVQWHPERVIGEESLDLPSMLPLFEYFVNLCRNDK